MIRLYNKNRNVIMEKFYNSDWNPEMFRKNIPHISHAIIRWLARKIWTTKIEVLENIILVLDNWNEEEKVKWNIIDLTPLEQLTDYTYE